MPPRQGHRKSRGGCTRCKVRKVKCDEARPVCSGCLRYPHQCVYLDAKPRRSAAPSERSTTSNGHASQQHLPTPPATPYADDSFDDLDEDQRRSLELLLLHNFIHYTCPTFPGYEKPDVARQWICTYIHHALEHDFLLHILLANSALHIVVDPPSWIGFGPRHEFDFARAHRVYLNMATKGHREALQSINATNAAALMFATMSFQYASLRLMPDDSEEDEYVLPVHWLSMSAAIRSVLQATSRYIQGSDSDFLKYLRDSAGPNFEDERETHDFEYGEPFKSILAFNDESEIVDDDLLEIYHQVSAYISKCNKVIAEAQEPEKVVARRLTAFGAMLPRPFISLFAQHRPRALVLAAQFFAMKKSLEQFWWLRGTAEHDVRGIHHLLPQKWHWAMERPLATLKTFSSRNYAPLGSGVGSQPNVLLHPSIR